MSVSELRCTNCLAPILPMTGGVQRCAYCGTTLVVDGGTASASPAVGALHLLDCGANKIQVIKVVRQYTGLGLKEAKELVERTPCVVAENLDAIRLQWFAADLVKAGARPSLGARPSAEVVSGGTSVVLEGRGSNPIRVIQVVREHTGLGLKEAKKLVESTPCALAQNLDPAHAAKFRDALVAAGARVRGGG